MSEWPVLSWRSRVFGALAVGLTLVQFSVIVMGPQEGPPMWQTNAMGMLVLFMSLVVMLWVVTQLHGNWAPPRWAAAAVITGATLRVWATLPITYELAQPPLAIPPHSELYVLALGYAFFVVGYGAIIVAFSKSTDSRQPLLWSVLGCVTIGVAFAFAAFGPLPQVPTQLTSRDHFALALLIGEMILLGQAGYITFASLQYAGGVMVRAWLWIALSSLMVAMGDVVWPLLSVYDAARYVPPLWGLAYTLGALGASIMLDTLDAREPRPGSARTAQDDLDAAES